MNRKEALIKGVETSIEYNFKNKKILYTAITHSSYANESKTRKLNSNERLEFLGDAVLDLVISEEIYTKYPKLLEGDMTKVRANVVCATTLAKCSEKLNLGKVLLLGKGEIVTGGRNRVSILSDAFESLLGAIYIDGGLESAKKFIQLIMHKVIDDSVKGVIFLDFKTQLQEIVQSKNIGKIEYEIISEKGPDHDKVFSSNVVVTNNIKGNGHGKTKKEAEQNAAKYVIENFFTD